VTDLDALQRQRLASWRQTPETRIADPAEAAGLIDRVGIATVFPASPEVPNLYHAHVGDPERKTDPQWDSPSGKVYTWRWELGRSESAFYSVLVRGRPTFVSWACLPAVLRLWAEPRMPDELYDRGELSEGAYRIVQALEASGGTLTTADLRREAGFPTGKDHRAAYLKAVDELDKRLMLAKVFSNAGEGDEMAHALVRVRYRACADEADRLTREDALEKVVLSYLPAAVYALPATLAKHLKLVEGEVREAFERLVGGGQARRIAPTHVKGDCYVWEAGSEDGSASAQVGRVGFQSDAWNALHGSVE
jgi:hypothetical protein